MNFDESLSMKNLLKWFAISWGSSTDKLLIIKLDMKTLSLHPPLGTQASARSASWMVPSSGWSPTYETVIYPRQVTTYTTAQLVNPFFLHTVHWTEFACTPFPQTPQGHFSEFTIIFPPLLQTITLGFPAFTFNHLSRRLALHSATRQPSCSIVGAIITRSSAYSNS